MSKVITGNGLHTVGLTTTTDEIPARDKLFKDDPLDANFLKQLGIKHSLDDLAEASDAHVLTRSREINVNWKDVYGESLKLSVAPIRQYFEDSWGMDVFDIAKVQIRKYDPGVGDDADTNKRYIPVLKHKPKDVLVVAALPDPPQDPPVKSIPQVANPWSSEELGRGKDFIVTHGVSKREYRLSFDEESVTHDAKVRPDSGNAAYLDRLIGEMDEGHPEKFWSYVTGVDLVIKATDKKNEQAFFMEVHTVDLSIQAVFERANTLLIQRAFAEKLDAEAAKVLERLDVGGSTQEIEVLMSQYVNLRGRLLQIDNAIANLVDKASDLGYVLIPTLQYVRSVMAPPLDDPNGKLISRKLTLDDGRPAIYTAYDAVHYWTTTETITKQLPGFLGIFKHRYTYTVAQAHSQRYVAYTPVKLDLDPWIELIEEMESGSLRPSNPLGRKYTTFLFELNELGYQTADGTTLEDVMERCDRDDVFRQQCALFIPAYEPDLSRGRVKTKYHIVKHPLKGLLNVAFPRFYLQEGLSHRILWQGAQLGQLLYSINMAPGEERKVTITRSLSKQVEEKKTATSLLDITETSSFDLATEIENESRNESATNNTVTWDVKSSASWGVFSGSAEAGGSHNWSSQKFAREFSKIARKAANSISRKSHQEISTSLSVRTDSMTSESTEIRIKNINEGRTLNLFFYQVDNQFKTAMYLNTLQFISLPGTQTVSGLNIFSPSTYDVGDLIKMLKDMRQYQLPIPDDKGDRKTMREFMLTSWDKIQKEMISRLLEILTKEYPGSKEVGDLIELPSELSGSSQVIPLRFLGELKEAKESFKALRARADLARTDLLSPPFNEVLEKLVALLERLESSLGKSKVFGSEQVLAVPSKAMYIDSMIGTRPATEPYAEEMRAQEIRLKAASVVTEANRYKQWECANDGGPRLPFPSAHVVKDNRILGFKIEAEFVLIGLVKGLDKPGDWDLYWGTKKYGKLSTESALSYRVSKRIPADEQSQIDLNYVYLKHEDGLVITI
jgi:hypothetical protein